MPRTVNSQLPGKMVPLEMLPGDRFRYHENTRKIIGERGGRELSIGDRVRVRLDRVDPVEKKLQFSLVTAVPSRPRVRKRGRRQ